VWCDEAIWLLLPDVRAPLQTDETAMKHIGPVVVDARRDDPQAHERLQRLRSLAWLLDSSIPLPGGFRIGLDAIIGLVPVVGDVAGALVAGFILNEARMLGAPRSVLLRMSANVLLEAVLGAVPILGDLFDAGYKANLRNIALLEQYQHHPQRSRRSSRWFMVGVVVALVAFVAVLVAIPVLLVSGVIALFR
jgi:hypothetical protein